MNQLEKLQFLKQNLYFLSKLRDKAISRKRLAGEFKGSTRQALYAAARQSYPPSRYGQTSPINPGTPAKLSNVANPLGATCDRGVGYPRMVPGAAVIIPASQIEIDQFNY